MIPFKIATWNVNSLRVRLPQILDWIKKEQPDVLAVQETKLLDKDFPVNVLHDAGYQAIFSGQKAYNGVAIFFRHNHFADVMMDIPGLEDHQRRVLAVTVDDIRILNLYVPNGEHITSEKYQYKLHWLSKLDIFLKTELIKYPKFIVLGDFNIAPEEIDVHDPKHWDGQVLFSEPERKAFRDILEIGFSDCYRRFHPGDKNFTWWDYRLNAFKRNIGLRIDHILVSGGFITQCVRCDIDRLPRAWERPSDHTPVVAEFFL